MQFSKFSFNFPSLLTFDYISFYIEVKRVMKTNIYTNINFQCSWQEHFVVSDGHIKKKILKCVPSQVQTRKQFLKFNLCSIICSATNTYEYKLACKDRCYNKLVIIEQFLVIYLFVYNLKVRNPN